MRKNSFKRTAVVLTAALILSMAVSGCGNKTVDYNVDGSGNDSNNGDGNASDTVGGVSDSGTIATTYGIPAECKTELDTGNSDLDKLEIYDLDVEYPEISSMDAFYYTREEMTNDKKKEIAETVFNKDRGIYEYDEGNPTKADIIEKIEEYKADLERSIDNGEDDDAEYFQGAIEEYESAQDEAPDEYPTAGDYSGDSFIGYMEGTEFTLDFVESSSTCILNLKEEFASYRPSESSDTADVCYFDTGASDEMVNTCTLSESEAQTVAENFMQMLDIGDMALIETKDLYWVYFDSSTSTNESVAVEADGYAFYFVRTVNNIPVCDKSIGNVDNLSGNGGTVDIPVESMYIYVDENGILYADWSEYLVPSDKGSENTELLSFDALLEKANENISEYYTNYPAYSTRVKFNSMELTYYIEDTDEDGLFKYTPVWVLSEYNESSDNSGERYPERMVVVDATDGEVIDLLSLSKKLGTFDEFDFEE